LLCASRWTYWVGVGTRELGPRHRLGLVDDPRLADDRDAGAPPRAVKALHRDGTVIDELGGALDVSLRVVFSVARDNLEGAAADAAVGVDVGLRGQGGVSDLGLVADRVVVGVQNPHDDRVAAGGLLGACGERRRISG
jgi:hypothetical protein